MKDDILNVKFGHMLINSNVKANNTNTKYVLLNSNLVYCTFVRHRQHIKL